jgi:hypothetical protein
MLSSIFYKGFGVPKLANVTDFADRRWGGARRLDYWRSFFASFLRLVSFRCFGLSFFTLS